MGGQIPHPSISTPAMLHGEMEAKAALFQMRDSFGPFGQIHQVGKSSI